MHLHVLTSLCVIVAVCTQEAYTKLDWFSIPVQPTLGSEKITSLRFSESGMSSNQAHANL